jgi:hypothetical protein
MGRPPSPDRDKFIIRLPDGMRERIKAAADANNRTMTAEIVARLRMTFDADNVVSDAQSKEAAKRLLAIGMPNADQVSAEQARTPEVTLSCLTEADYDYIAGKVLARLQRDDDGSN